MKAFKFFVLLSILHQSLLISINLALVAKNPTLSLDKNLFKENGIQNILKGGFNKPSHQQTEKVKLWEKFIRFLGEIRFPALEFWNKKNPSLSTADSLYRLSNPGLDHPNPESSYTSYRKDLEPTPVYVTEVRSIKTGGPPSPIVRRKRSNAQDQEVPQKEPDDETSASENPENHPDNQTSIEETNNGNQLMIITKSKSSPVPGSDLMVKGRTAKSADSLEGLIHEAHTDNVGSYSFDVQDLLKNGMTPDGSFLYPNVYLDPHFPLKQQMIRDLLQNSQIDEQNFLLNGPQTLENQRHTYHTNPELISDQFDTHMSELTSLDDVVTPNRNDKNLPENSNVPLQSFVAEESIQNFRDVPLVEEETQIHPFITRFEQFALPPNAPSVQSVNTMHLTLVQMMNNLTKLLQSQNLSVADYEAKPMENATIIFENGQSSNSGVRIGSQPMLHMNNPNANTAQNNLVTDDPRGDRNGGVDVQKMLTMVNKMMEDMEEVPLSRETIILMEMLDKLARNVFALDKKRVPGKSSIIGGNVPLRQNSSVSNGTMMGYGFSPGSTNSTEEMGDPGTRMMADMLDLEDEMKKGSIDSRTNDRPSSESDNMNRRPSPQMPDDGEDTNTNGNKGVLERMLEQILLLDGGITGQSGTFSSNRSIAKDLALVAMKDELENYSSLPLHMQTLRLPLTNTNVLKLVIEAHLLNKTTNSTAAPKGNLKSELKPAVFGRQLGSQFKREDEDPVNSTGLPFDPPLGTLDPSNDSTLLNSFNLTSDLFFVTENGTFPSHSRICHMCVNIFQSPNSHKGLRVNSTNPFKVGTSLGLGSILMQDKGSGGGADLTQDDPSSKVSITQVNYAGSRLGQTSQTQGWIPSMPTWLQNVKRFSFGPSDLQGRASSLSVYPPISRTGRPSEGGKRAKERKMSGFITFPTNKPFNAKHSKTATQVDPSFYGVRTPQSIMLSGPFVSSSAAIIADPKGASSRLQTRRQEPSPSGGPSTDLSKTYYSRSLPPDSKVSWPQPNLNYPVW